MPKKKAAQSVWTEAQMTELIKLYNDPKQLSIKEIAFRMNRKFKVQRNVSSVGQRLVQIRKDQPKALTKRKKTSGYTSKAAIVAFNEKASKHTTSKGTALARVDVNETLPPDAITVVAEEEVLPKRIFAYQTPDVTVQVQIEGHGGTDQMLKDIAKTVVS